MKNKVNGLKKLTRFIHFDKIVKSLLQGAISSQKGVVSVKT